MGAMVDADRPLIALNGLSDAADGEPGLRLHDRYAEAVLRGGGIPVALPPVGGPGDIERVLARVDGLVLCGGDDFDTERLGLGPVHPAATVTPRAKQDFDLALVRAAVALGKPMLGICYGMQCLGLYSGAGTGSGSGPAGAARLLQHLPEDRPGCQEHSGGVEHRVRVDPESKLAALLGVATLPVISRHHQALTDVAPPWRVAATDEEGLVEAIEHPDLAFAIGVQWHPELSAEGSVHDRLFRSLAHAASLVRADDLFARSRS